MWPDQEKHWDLLVPGQVVRKNSPNPCEQRMYKGRHAASLASTTSSSAHTLIQTQDICLASTCDHPPEASYMCHTYLAKMDSTELVTYYLSIPSTCVDVYTTACLREQS